MDPSTTILLRDVHVDYVVMRHGMRSIKEFVLSLGVARMLERHHILRGIDLQINAGECFGIVGRNGSGKSTLLRVLAGILEPTRGQVDVRGRVAPMLALGVGLEQELTGTENARLCAALMGCDRAATQATLDNVRSFSGLSEDDLRMPVKRYSSGMTARLGFSIATANDPDILLIDEVLAVGDAEFQQRCHARIGELKRNGSTVVLVSHSLGEVQRVCDRAACVENGRIVIVGHPHEVGSHYHQLLGIPSVP
jgi:ABC-type polysaccharide/polyol phosphate transport system ATPase subunit